LEWSSTKSNSENFSDFTTQLFDSLEKPIVTSAKQSCNHDKLWKSYFLLRSSESFVNLWTTFLKSVNLTPTPILYQHLTNIIFRNMVNNHFVCSSSGCSNAVAAVSHQEGSVLRYAAGYVCRHLQKKIKCESHELKDE